jgi:hypothetical protein
VLAQYVHRGSSSQDILDTGAMLVPARALTLVRADLARCVDALAALATRHRDTPMAGRTLALHAVPTTFGFKAAGWRHLLLTPTCGSAASRTTSAPRLPRLTGSAVTGKSRKAVSQYRRADSTRDRPPSCSWRARSIGCGTSSSAGLASALPGRPAVR